MVTNVPAEPEAVHDNLPCMMVTKTCYDRAYADHGNSRPMTASTTFRGCYHASILLLTAFKVDRTGALTAFCRSLCTKPAVPDAQRET